MVSLALEQMEAGTLFDVICETRSCLPDAIQMLTPCTIGNGRLKIRDLGRYALVMYDKFTGQGIRVFRDPAKLTKWPEFHHWFYKTKPKFESLAVSWLFPGKKVRIDSPCLDCGEPITIEMCDGVIEKADPEGIIGHVSVPVSKWRPDIAYA